MAGPGTPVPGSEEYSTVLQNANNALESLQAARARAADRLAEAAADKAASDAVAGGRGGKKRKGMQFNPGVPTIEGALEGALIKAGGIAAEHKGDPSKVSWLRAARTDKGVSAMGQVVSVKLMLLPPGLVERINANLPPQIRVFGVRRTTGSFNARTDCDMRRYEYVLPEWAFDPDLFPARPGWRPASAPPPALCSDDVPDSACTAFRCGSTTYRVRNGYSMTAPPPCSDFVFDAECEARLTEVLDGFVGTHNFHNFSPAVHATQMAAQRHMISFRCHGTLTIEAARWVRMEVLGDSFLLNQIRNMVGMAVAVYRGTAPPDAIRTALDPNRDFSTPLAPELGLLLCECIFNRYNETAGNEREPLSLSDWGAEVGAFKDAWIYPKLAERDTAEAVNYKWLQGLTDERYLFSKWSAAKPVRNEKRPRTKAESEARRLAIRRREERIEQLVAGGMPKRDAVDLARREMLEPGCSEARALPVHDAPAVARDTAEQRAAGGPEAAAGHADSPAGHVEGDGMRIRNAE